jgi:hypothetical protein
LFYLPHPLFVFHLDTTHRDFSRTRIELDYESPRKRYEILVRAASPPLRIDVIVEIKVVDYSTLVLYDIVLVGCHE